jgi:hypothetical protein
VEIIRSPLRYDLFHRESIDLNNFREKYPEEHNVHALLVYALFIAKILRVTNIWRRKLQTTGMVSSWLATFQIKVLV